MGTRTLDRRRSDSPHRAPILDRFGVAVRGRRELLDLTRAELEQRSGIPRNYIGSIERGEINPTLLTQQRIALGLGVRLAELVTEAEENAALDERLALTEARPQATL
jgi:transcriptional regulator with XRE-family HTH domain